MDKTNHNVVINQQELDFIAGLEHESNENDGLLNDSEVFVTNAELSFFKHFSKADSVGVVAQYGNHRLFFSYRV